MGEFYLYFILKKTNKKKKQLRHGSHQKTTFVAAKVAQVFTGLFQFISVFRQHAGGGVIDEGRRVPVASCFSLSAIALPD